MSDERFLKPQTIDRSTWYYEERDGLRIVHEARTKSENYSRGFSCPGSALVAFVAEHVRRQQIEALENADVKTILQIFTA